MDAVAAGGEVQSNDADRSAVGSGLMCRRNALPDVLDEAVTKMPTVSAVNTLTRLHSIHGKLYHSTSRVLFINVNVNENWSRHHRVVYLRKVHY